MTTFTLRPGTPDDAPACAAILNAWIDATPWMPRCHTPEDLERHYREFVLQDRACTLVVDGDDILGFMALDMQEGYVTALYLDAANRGNGIGAALLDHARSVLPDQINLWTFVANTGAQRFYERQGFTKIGGSEGDNEENLPDILYTWIRENPDAA